MTDPWELILDYAFTGQPGVVFDQSPGRQSHGVAINMVGEFHIDGIAPGSGAVSFGTISRIQVPHLTAWQPLTGLRAEIVCIRDDDSGGRLMEGDSFAISVLDSGDLAFSCTTIDGAVAGGSTGEAAGVSPPVPKGEWVTIGFLYDGVSTVQMTVGDTTYIRSIGPLSPLGTVSSLTIGNNSAANQHWAGRIDDMKVWRPNPNFVNNNFTLRPLNPAEMQCWTSWAAQLEAALADLGRRNPEIPDHIFSLLDRALSSGLTEAMNHSADSAARWQQAAQQYLQLWFGGDVAGIAPVIAGLLSQMQSEGLDLSANADFRTLANDSWFEMLVAATPPIDCDPDFAQLLSGIGRN